MRRAEQTMALWGRAARAVAGLMFVSVLSPPGALAEERLIIRDVAVVDPQTGTVASERDVTVSDGVVESIAAAGTADATEGARVVDGSGRFLVPGLWDMHVHLDAHTEADLVMLVANGVLHVRDMGGDPFLAAELESRVDQGELLGPEIFAAGSILEDRRWLTRARTVFPDLEHRLPVDNPEEARATVAMLASWGADLVKIRNVTDEPTLRATLAAARDHGLTVAGHEPIVVPIARAAELGMTTIEHLPFLTLTFPGAAATEDEVEATIETWRTTGAYLVPTLIASRSLGDPREVREAAIARPDDRYRYLPATVKAEWIESLDGGVGPLPWAQMREASLGIARRAHAAGVPVLAGTDMGVPLTFPGSSLHDEIELLGSQLGLEPIEALRAATTDAASLFGRDGRVRVGAPADFVLLDQNPLESVGAVRSIGAVVRRGELFDRDRLDTLLDEVEATKDAGEPWSTYERLQSSCDERPTTDCLERLAGYRYSKGEYADAFATYGRAVVAGGGVEAEEGRFASAVNLLFAGEGGCAEKVSAFDPVLERHVGDPNRTVGTLDRILPALWASCRERRVEYLRRAHAVPVEGVSEDWRPIWGEHVASFLVEVRGDAEAAWKVRVDAMDEGWRERPIESLDVVRWCVDRGVALESARAIARRVQEIAVNPNSRLTAMLLEAEAASGMGDHQGALTLLEAVDAIVPGHPMVTPRLEAAREAMAEESAGS